mmetsp:Transcript_34924/g.39604  ORF Transcript_34924/g.39604 Transcript_34924/m.39604 type:complete len:645 (-) Transcript_34924:111-2045(-)
MSNDRAACIYRMEKGPPVVRRIFEELGWVEWDEAIHGADEWNITWRQTRPTVSEVKYNKPYQWFNHFPKSGTITRKDNLSRHLRKMKGIYGQIYDFSPLTFMLPSEYTKFVSAYSQQEEKGIWICKPANSSQGRKIFLIRDLGDLTYDCQSIIQRYIANPHLIGGYKWDMRIYVLASSFFPMKLHLYREGLIRFSTSKYDLNSLDDRYSHLTNYSVNKFSPAMSLNKEVIGQGAKWTFKMLQDYLESHGVDSTVMWKKIEIIIILSMLNVATTISKATCSFEIFGFDVLIDDNLKPWLVEINSSPALSVEGEVDEMVKTALLADMTKVLDCKPASSYEKEKKKVHRSYLPESMLTGKSKKKVEEVREEPRTRSRSTYSLGAVEHKKSLSSASEYSDKPPLSRAIERNGKAKIGRLPLSAKDTITSSSLPGSTRSQVRKYDYPKAGSQIIEEKVVSTRPKGAERESVQMRIRSSKNPISARTSSSFTSSIDRKESTSDSITADTNDTTEETNDEEEKELKGYNTKKSNTTTRHTYSKSSTASDFSSKIPKNSSNFVTNHSRLGRNGSKSDPEGVYDVDKTKNGNFDQIFPCNSKTARLALELSKHSGNAKKSLELQNVVRQIIGEIKMLDPSYKPKKSVGGTSRF